MLTARHCAAVALLVLALATPAHGAFGDLDPGFGAGGIALLVSGSVDPGDNPYGVQLTAVAVGADGTVAVAGTWSRGTLTGRLTAAGGLDPAFNGGQLARLQIPNWGSQGTAVAFDGQGRIVLGGYALQYDPVSQTFREQVLLVRYGRDGSLDPSFGTGGITQAAPPDGRYVRATAIAIRPDGRVLVAGWASTASMHVLVARFDADGHPDASFGQAGWAISDRPEMNALAISVQPDERIVVAGDQSLGGIVGRMLADGQPDLTFGRPPTRLSFSGFGPDTNFRGVRALPSGRILAAGDGPGGPYVVGLVPGGTEDPAYYAGPPGVRSQFARPGGGEGPSITALATDAGGRALLTGHFGPTKLTGDALLAALDGNGYPSRALGGTPPGLRRLAIPGYGAVTANAIALGPDGRLVLAGAAQPTTSGAYTGFVMRVQPDLPPAAALTAPAQARVGQAATFDASGSSDPEGALFRFVWDFDGDGVDDADTGTQPKATYSFRGAGRVNARVRVIDEGGAVAQASAVVTVAPATGDGGLPVARTLAVVRRLSGRVLVRRPGARKFSRLSGTATVPMGTEIDARKGKLRLTVAGTGVATESLRVWAGRFKVRQAAETTLTLTGTLPRRLWADGKGRFRLRGRFATAAASDAAWLVEDKRASTRVRVRRGRSSVRSTARGAKARSVRAGKTLLVRRRS